MATYTATIYKKKSPGLRVVYPKVSQAVIERYKKNQPKGEVIEIKADARARSRTLYGYTHLTRPYGKSSGMIKRQNEYFQTKKERDEAMKGKVIQETWKSSDFRRRKSQKTGLLGVNWGAIR